MADQLFDLGTARRHSGALAILRARKMVYFVILLPMISLIVVGLALVIGLVGWVWQTDVIHVALLMTGAALVGIGTWFTGKLLFVRAIEFPQSMSISSAGVEFRYPDGGSAALAWTDPNFELELREVRPPAFRADGPMLNIEWNERVQGQSLPRHIHGIVSREAFVALDTEATSRGFDRIRVVSETPPMVSFVFRPVRSPRGLSNPV